MRLLKDTFGRLLRRRAKTNLKKLIKKTHPADLAIVFRYFNDDEQIQIFELMQSSDHTIEFLVELDDTLIQKILNIKSTKIIENIYIKINIYIYLYTWQKHIKNHIRHA